MSEQITPQNATRADFTKQIRRLQWYLGLIAARPLEFNTKSTALAQEALSEKQLIEPDGSALLWLDELGEETRDKVLRRGSHYGANDAVLSPKGGKGMNQATKTAQEGKAEQEPAKTNETTTPEIFMIEVESSNLARVGFHSGDVLRVQFKSKTDEPGIFTGDLWDYKGIAKSEYVDLVNADSPGQTYNALTKNRGIKGTKVDFKA